MGEMGSSIIKGTGLFFFLAAAEGWGLAKVKVGSADAPQVWEQALANRFLVEAMSPGLTNLTRRL